MDRNPLSSLALALLLVTISAVSAPESSIAASPFADTRITVIQTDEVLAHHTETRPDGELLFRHPNGAKVRMLTTVEDPEISNRGDGAFHPVDPELVYEALEALPLDMIEELDVAIYILPYPRSGLLSSSADSGAIYLSPGTLEIRPEHVHFLVAHEIGHVFHRRYLPEHDREGWAEYARLRGTTGVEFHGHAAHAYRPHELFSEDFRVLFGGDLARGDGSIENREVTPPMDVPGLPEFFLRFVSTSTTLAGGEWTLGPNPVQRGGTTVLRAPESIDRDPVIELFDVSGRNLGQVPMYRTSSQSWEIALGPWSLVTGTYWIRVLNGSASPVVLPVRWLR